MCAVMWRDFHEQPHWLDTETSDLDMMARPLQTWSCEEDEAKRRTQHQAEDDSGKFRQGEDQSLPEATSSQMMSKDPVAQKSRSNQAPSVRRLSKSTTCLSRAS